MRTQEPCMGLQGTSVRDQPAPGCACKWLFINRLSSWAQQDLPRHKQHHSVRWSSELTNGESASSVQASSSVFASPPQAPYDQESQTPATVTPLPWWAQPSTYEPNKYLKLLFTVLFTFGFCLFVTVVSSLHSLGWSGICYDGCSISHRICDMCF